ncbi:RNA-directed DNA polymerase, eukaryota, nucleotide-binding alpha-beta plait domain protein [Tanacetum coccineum]
MGEDWQEVPSRNHRRSNADDVSKVAKSVFVTNFPESVSARDLWKSCSVYGTVVDVFIPSKKSKAGMITAYGLRPVSTGTTRATNLLQVKRGLKSVSIRRIQGVGYGVLEFLGVGTTLDIFQNILFSYSLNMTYFLSWIRRIGLVSFVVFGEYRHRYAVSSLMDTAYWLSE